MFREEPFKRNIQGINLSDSGAAIGATGAMLGKASVGKLDSFVKKCGLNEVPAPAKHPHIPSPGTVWSDADKKYWIGLYNTLKTATIGGKKIDSLVNPENMKMELILWKVI